MNAASTLPRLVSAWRRASPMPTVLRIMLRNSGKTGQCKLTQYTLVLADGALTSTPARSRLLSSFQTALYCAPTLWVSALACKRTSGLSKKMVSKRTRTREENRACSTNASVKSITFGVNYTTFGDRCQTRVPYLRLIRIFLSRFFFLASANAFSNSC